MPGVFGGHYWMIKEGLVYVIDKMICIRPIAIGRRNWLFAGSHNAAQRSAMVYSLFATCKLHNIEPVQWLTEILSQIKDYKINRIHEMLPQNYLANK